MSKEQNLGVKKFYQNSSKPRNYVPSALVTSPPEYPPVMSGLMQINPETKDIWISAGKELVSDWINVAGGGGGGNIAVQFNGTPVSAAATTLNFVGAQSVSGDPLVTVTIPQTLRVIKDTKDGTIVTNSFAEELTYSVFIPKNTLVPGSILRITYRVKKDPLNNTGPARIGIKVGTTLPTATAIAESIITWSLTDPNAFGQIKREVVYTENTLLTKFLTNKASAFDDNIEAIGEDRTFIDWTLDQTVFFTIQHLSGLTDVAFGSFYCIEIY